MSTACGAVVKKGNETRGLELILPANYILTLTKKAPGIRKLVAYKTKNKSIRITSILSALSRKERDTNFSEQS